MIYSGYYAFAEIILIFKRTIYGNCKRFFCYPSFTELMNVGQVIVIILR